MFDHSKVDKGALIQARFPVTDQEYNFLQETYGKLCWYAANKLVSRNHRNDDDLHDYYSDIQIGMMRAASYHKRQVYIRETISFLQSCCSFMPKEEVEQIEKIHKIWENKRSDIDEEYEFQLTSMLKKYKSFSDIVGKPIPDINKPLVFDNEFNVYCKAIIWNTSKAIGQFISKENEFRNREISLDEYGFLEGGDSFNELEEGISYTQNHWHTDFESIREQLGKIDNSRPLEVFDILTDSANFDKVFKKKSRRKNGIKINIVRQKTQMSYRTINNQIKIIRELLEKELG